MTTTDNKEKKRKYSTEEVKRYLVEWRESGKSQITFSKEKGINYYTLNKWINERKSKKSVKSKTGVFSEIKLPVAASGIFAEIRGSGLTVVLHREVSADYLRKLIQ